MGLPQQIVRLTPEQIADIDIQLSELRHNVNNHLAMMVAALELIRRKPDTTTRMVNTINEQPQKILEDIKKFSDEFEEFEKTLILLVCPEAFRANMEKRVAELEKKKAGGAITKHEDDRLKVMEKFLRFETSPNPPKAHVLGRTPAEQRAAGDK